MSSNPLFFFLLFFADNTFILLNYFVFDCQSQGCNNEDARAAWAWLSYKRLVLHVVEGFVQEVPSDERSPHSKHAQTNVCPTCAGKL